MKILMRFVSVIALIGGVGVVFAGVEVFKSDIMAFQGGTLVVVAVAAFALTFLPVKETTL